MIKPRKANAVSELQLCSEDPEERHVRWSAPLELSSASLCPWGSSSADLAVLRPEEGGRTGDKAGTLQAAQTTPNLEAPGPTPRHLLLRAPTSTCCLPRPMTPAHMAPTGNRQPQCSPCPLTTGERGALQAPVHLQTHTQFNFCQKQGRRQAPASLHPQGSDMAAAAVALGCPADGLPPAMTQQPPADSATALIPPHSQEQMNSAAFGAVCTQPQGHRDNALQHPE